MRPLPRDYQIVDLLFQARALTQTQIQTALFSLGDATSCARRLRILLAEHWIDRLPRRSPNEPFIYLLSRRATVGTHLMRQVYGNEAYRAKTTRIGSLDHLLGINEVRARVIRAAQESGWHLNVWMDSSELAPLLDGQLVPDAYFQLQRPVDGQLRTSGFFLEVERSTKSEAILESKLTRYAELSRSGRYQELFGTRAMRVLVVFTSDYRVLPRTRIESARRLAAQLGTTMAFFAALEEIASRPPQAMLTMPLWAQADQTLLRCSSLTVERARSEITAQLAAPQPRSPVTGKAAVPPSARASLRDVPGGAGRGTASLGAVKPTPWAPPLRSGLR